ncbi:Glycosyltransferase involved in cell wall bisynthesis [Desulfacinum hydrothermale DSM 13146]|uniref:Glycosyltransferase involved in cell wall bisynthesis n=1 Tax=Desulfacinum hydrothermale DSM 13146 TaxID=1121390 RepID=A0A1W1X110_9BACT|nr:glycosyltransferase [Desulfacinum hydrothermale]SMC17656.1 Glycosyltransferase involved in cell wall bisynthesis [Desulfacinum hydrothermale DSM 13146]
MVLKWRPPKIAITAFSFGDGGTEKMLVHLARGLEELGCSVDFLLAKTDSPYVHTIGNQLNVLEIQARTSRERMSALCRYLAGARPQILLSGKRSDEEVVAAGALTRGQTRTFLRIGTTLSARDNRSPFKLLRTTWKLKRLLPRADGVIAVSRGVAEDIQRLLGKRKARIHVVPNPVIAPEIDLLAQAPLDHPYFHEHEKTPVIVGMGGMRKAKDFPTLLRAFALVRQKTPALLIILGKGRQKDKLIRLARDLGVLSWVSFPGFVQNPYAYLARATVFVLSSLREGSPNVLTEALAVGTPVVSTDCPSGPREILHDGKYGRLVPCGNPEAMAAAILETLEKPIPKPFLKDAVQDYTLRASAQKYLEVFGYPLR